MEIQLISFDPTLTHCISTEIPPIFYLLSTVLSTARAAPGTLRAPASI